MKDELLELGFSIEPGNILVKYIGGCRSIRIYDYGSLDECVFICYSPEDDKMINDSICIRSWCYNGPTYTHHIHDLLAIVECKN